MSAAGQLQTLLDGHALSHALEERPMNWQDVESSNISAIGYDAATRTLGVRFKNGGTYHCLGVEAKDHEAFMAADSHGKHFHSFLKHLHFKRQEEKAEQ